MATKSVSRWATALSHHGHTLALLAEDGERLEYAELLGRAQNFAEQLGPARKLVLLQVRNDIPSIVAWLGCLVSGKPTILLPTGHDSARIRAAFRPEASWSADDEQLGLKDEALGGLHPDLALLLSTSGSTGSPRLVRLSDSALLANARSIVDFLQLGPAERAVTTLPFCYSYGLSILHSHLLAGASLAVADLPVTHPRFEAFLNASQPTSLAGVPLLHQQLMASGLAGRLPASVRTLTQAGGRMPPEDVRAMIALGDAHGFRFIPMYGQTEATARMAWLPPELARTNPDCIGVAIPGGEFRLIDNAGGAIEAPLTAGELLYRGPNVMMGYAETRADLARGPELQELHTGDIAERTEAGLYRIIGRKSRFAKVAGHRIGFDDMEVLFRMEGARATVAGRDGLVVAHIGPRPPSDPAALVGRVAAAAHLPETALVLVEGDVPLLPSGKPDLPAILKAGEQAAEARDMALGSGVHPILAGYRSAFGRAGLQPSSSFQSLGGDSLAHVHCAIALERALGELPRAWESMPIAQLIELDAQSSVTANRRLPRVESEHVIRFLAVATIILGHASPSQAFWLKGGLGMLMLLAGFSFARFQQGAFEAGRPGPALRGMLERLILPYFAVMVPILLVSDLEASPAWFTLTSVFFVPDRGPLQFYWVIETLAHLLLAMTLLFAIPAVRRASARSRFVFGLALFAGTVLLWAALQPLHAEGPNIAFTLDRWLPYYVLGMLAAGAVGNERQRMSLLVLVLLLGSALALWDSGYESARTWRLVTGLALILWLPSVPLPRWIARPLLATTAAGYFIYLMHAPLLHLLYWQAGLPKGLLLAAILLPASIVAGMLFERVWMQAMGLVSRNVRSGAGAAAKPAANSETDRRPA